MRKKFVSDVFAPGVDEFISSKKLFFLDLAQLGRWLDDVSYKKGSLLRLLDEASVANMLFICADFISANLGQVLPMSLRSIVDSLPAAQLDFQGYCLLQPDEEKFIELIIGTGLKQPSTTLPNAPSRSMVEWGIGEVVVESFQQAITTAFAVIFVLLLLYFRG